jgi:hypothetical protein
MQKAAKTLKMILLTFRSFHADILSKTDPQKATYDVCFLWIFASSNGVSWELKKINNEIKKIVRNVSMSVPRLVE